jgi:hypothetical protein
VIGESIRDAFRACSRERRRGIRRLIIAYSRQDASLPLPQNGATEIFCVGREDEVLTSTFGGDGLRPYTMPNCTGRFQSSPPGVKTNIVLIIYNVRNHIVSYQDSLSRLLLPLHLNHRIYQHGYGG